jgi:integrase
LTERGIYERIRGSGLWWIRFSDGTGRERREKAGTRSAARKLYSKRKQEVLEGRKLPESLRARTATFGKLLDAAKEHSDRDTPPGAEKRYKCRVELLRRAFGSLPADSITPQMLSRWLANAAEENEWRPATANRYKAYISLTFRLGMENGKCQSNPARLVKRLREHNERIRFLSEDEEKRLRDVIHRDHPTHIPELDIALHTGVRRGEQYKLRWSDVDMQGRRITLRQTKNGTTRHVPLNSAALNAFQILRKRSKGKGRVFIGERGSPLQRPRFWWDAAVATAKVTDFRWHDLRHTFASRCVMKGVDLRTLAQLLGHKTLQMVMRYSHLSQAHELAAVERLCDTGTNMKKRPVPEPVLTRKRVVGIGQG